jgi:hypothetical protein
MVASPALGPVRQSAVTPCWAQSPPAVSFSHLRGAADVTGYRHRIRSGRRDPVHLSSAPRYQGGTLRAGFVAFHCPLLHELSPMLALTYGSLSIARMHEVKVCRCAVRGELWAKPTVSGVRGRHNYLLISPSKGK